MNQLWFYIFLLPIFSFCLAVIKPGKDFSESKNLIAPDYSNLKYWASHPDIIDKADQTPTGSNLKDKQQSAKADVFFIHPTTYLNGKLWNGDLEDEALNNRTDDGTMKAQASAFNKCCKIYAPRYRQAVLYVFLKETEEGKHALDFAYQDVKNSFYFYIKNWNRGRPWILASHSQGSRHAARLYKEEISKLPESKKMVAAYLIGRPISVEDTGLKACDSELETNCLIVWNTYLYGKRPSKDLDEMYKKSVCTNPLSWKTDFESVEAAQNPGSVFRSFDKIYPGNADAKCENGILWTHKPSHGSLIGDNYHIADISLYYISIRENAFKRVEGF